MCILVFFIRIWTNMILSHILLEELYKAQSYLGETFQSFHKSNILNVYYALHIYCL